jgi:hypothetical protein
MIMPLDLDSIFRSVASFVLVRQKADGGFGATIHLPSTVEDTYYSLSILNDISTYVSIPSLDEVKKELPITSIQ